MIITIGLPCTVLALNQLREDLIFGFWREDYPYVDERQYLEDIACKDRTFEDCCKRTQWHLWYPYNRSEPMNSVYNKAVRAETVETSLFNNIDISPFSWDSVSARWEAWYQCDDTRPWDEMFLTEPVAEYGHVERTLHHWIFYCPFLQVMVVNDPVPMSGATNSIRRTVRCVPNEQAPRHLKLRPEKMGSQHVIVAGGQVHCIRATVFTETIHRLRLAVAKHKTQSPKPPPSREEDARRAIEYNEAIASSSYALEAEEIEVPYMSLGTTATSITAGLQAAHQQLSLRQTNFRTSSMEVSVQERHAYSGCAEAPLNTEIDLFMTVLPLDSSPSFPAIENK